MSGNESPAAAAPGASPPARMSVQCTKCGHVQELDPDYRICLNCGGPVGEQDFLILKNPRKGRGMEGLAILAFLLFLFIFFFWSKYIGRYGMAISALVAIWGYYKNYLHRREAQEEHARR